MERPDRQGQATCTAWVRPDCCAEQNVALETAPGSGRQRRWSRELLSGRTFVAAQPPPLPWRRHGHSGTRSHCCPLLSPPGQAEKEGMCTGAERLGLSHGKGQVPGQDAIRWVRGYLQIAHPQPSASGPGPISDPTSSFKRPSSSLP